MTNFGSELIDALPNRGAGTIVADVAMASPVKSGLLPSTL